jgi:REP element-mobilizing transposase RayT
MSRLKYQPYYRRNLPHLQPLGATFFVTFRLAGSLPRVLLEQWAQDSRQHAAEQALIAGEQERERRQREWQKLWFYRFERSLDTARSGPVWLRDERVAALVGESLGHRDGKFYRLDAYCIMPNHVHVVFTPFAVETGSLPHSLAAILQSLKGYTARRANHLLGRRGAFWAHESYDHYIRTETERERIVAYVLNNPVKAGLAQDWHEWHWTYYRDPGGPNP